MSEIVISSATKQELRETFSRPINLATLHKDQEPLFRNQLKLISAPQPAYASREINVRGTSYELDFKPSSQLSTDEVQQIIEIANSYGYDPSKPLSTQGQRGFLGSANSATKFIPVVDRIIGNEADYILIKQSGKIVAFTSAIHASRNFPEGLIPNLSIGLTRRHIPKNGFYILTSVVADNQKTRGLFRLMIEALKDKYQAGFVVSTIEPQNTASKEAHYAIGAEDVGASENGQRVFVLDFEHKYIRSGDLKPTKVLYPIKDPSGDYANFSDVHSTHKAEYGELHARDFSGSIGTPIFAIQEGKVIYIQQHNDDQPPKQSSNSPEESDVNFMVIQSPDGSLQNYSHIMKDSALVRVGDQIQAGEEIAKIGHNGLSSAPHLHLSLLGLDEHTPYGYNSIPLRFRECD